ncbi:MAG: hypothetical protein WA419_18400 [Silvibacterium sp.]
MKGRGFGRVEIGDKENATLVAEGIFPCEYYSPFDAANRQTLRYANRIYSDGLTEAENGKGESFGDAMLPNLFALKQNLSAETFAEALLQSVLAWRPHDRLYACR